MKQQFLDTGHQAAQGRSPDTERKETYTGRPTVAPMVQERRTHMARAHKYCRGESYTAGDSRDQEQVPGKYLDESKSAQA